MKKDKIEKIEDIYPLTIVTMRYGGKIVIFNSESDNDNIHEIQLGEEPHYRLNEWMEENVSPQCYGIGDTIWDAFEDYKKRHYGLGIGQNILREMKEEREIELLKQAVNDKKLIGNMGQPLFFNEKMSLTGCNGQPIIRKNGKLIDNLGLPVVILSRELEELMLELG